MQSHQNQSSLWKTALWTFFKISPNLQKTESCVWKDIKVRKWWPNIYFCLNYLLKTVTRNPLIIYELMSMRNLYEKVWVCQSRQCFNWDICFPFYGQNNKEKCGKIKGFRKAKVKDPANTIISHPLNWPKYSQLLRPYSTSTLKVLWHWLGNP